MKKVFIVFFTALMCGCGNNQQASKSEKSAIETTLDENDNWYSANKTNVFVNFKVVGHRVSGSVENNAGEEIAGIIADVSMVDQVRKVGGCKERIFVMCEAFGGELTPFEAVPQSVNLLESQIPKYIDRSAGTPWFKAEVIGAVSMRFWKKIGVETGTKTNSESAVMDICRHYGVESVWDESGETRSAASGQTKSIGKLVDRWYSENKSKVGFDLQWYGSFPVTNSALDVTIESGFAGSITNNSDDQIRAVVAELIIENSATGKEAIRERAWFTIPAFKTEVSDFKAVEGGVLGSEFPECRKRLGTNAVWGSRVVAIVPKALNDEDTDITLLRYYNVKSGWVKK